ncbi:WD40 repeat-like protein [Rickenella mellea]|uniref:WD40 repeat-like protein n=1 Tax=Rickenella mellea TaxID=50990 RepID=A0A4R5XG09_9AGAM|nr:WD40 repeat-like protein [Rickenella mellea]
MSLQFVNAHNSAEQNSDAVWGVHWTADDQVVSVSADGRIRLLDAKDGQTIRERPPHTLGLVSLSVPTGGGGQGQKALYNSLDGLTVLWDLTDGAVVGTHESYVRAPKDPAEPSWSVSLHPSGGTYASTGGSGCVTVHSADPGSFGERLQKLETGRSKFGMYTSHPRRRTRIALSTETGQIYIFDATSSTLLSTYASHAMAVRQLAWSADSTLLLSASDDRRLVLHDVRAGAGGGGGGGGGGKPGAGAVASFGGHSSWVLSAAFSPDGRLALSGSADKTAKVWDIGARAAVSTVADTGEVWSVSWRPQAGAGNAFVTGGEDGVVKWWRGAGA